MYLDSIYLGLNDFRNPYVLNHGVQLLMNGRHADPRKQFAAADGGSAQFRQGRHECSSVPDAVRGASGHHPGNVPGRAEACLLCGLEVGCSGAFREASHVASLSRSHVENACYIDPNRPETLKHKP